MRRCLLAAVILTILALSSRTSEAQSSTLAGKVAVQATQSAVKMVASARPTMVKISGMVKRTYRRIVGYFGAGTSWFGPGKFAAGDLKPPKDHCVLPKDGAKEIYDHLKTNFGTDIDPVQFSIPCRELPKFWQGEPAARWAVYTVSETVLPKDATRSGLVVEMTKTFPEIKLAELEKVTRQVRSLEKAGIVDATPDAVYVASIGRDDSGRMVAHVGGITLMSRRVVSFNFYSTYRGVKSLDEMLGSVRDAVTRSLEAALPQGDKK